MAASAKKTERGNKRTGPRFTLHVPDPAGSPSRIQSAISLVPEGFREREWSPAALVVVLVVLLGFAVAVVTVPWVMLQRSNTDRAEKVMVLEERRADLGIVIAESTDRMRAVEDTIRRAKALGALLDQHRSWNALFRLIEDRTVPGVRYGELAADESGSVALPSFAPSVRTTVEQIAAWEQAPGVLDVDTGGYGSTISDLNIVQSTNFNLLLKIDPSIFSAESKN
jgi:hypothetical protein